MAIPQKSADLVPLLESVADPERALAGVSKVNKDKKQNESVPRSRVSNDQQ